jgi:xanthine dehydrogenase YagR molybdenum-binding subunit
MSAVQDMGTGTKTMLAVIVAEEFGIPPSSVIIRIGDTRFPIGPDSGGSVTAGSITPAARNAAYQAKQKLFAAVAPGLGTTADNLALQNGRVVFKNNASRSYAFKQVTAKLPTDEISAQATRVAEYSKERITYGGVDYVELAVDTETGRVHIEKVFGAHDCGRPINPTGVISPINGGILQGISYALFEQRIMDRNAGYMLNANLETTKSSAPVRFHKSTSFWLRITLRRVQPMLRALASQPASSHWPRPSVTLSTTQPGCACGRFRYTGNVDRQRR